MKQKAHKYRIYPTVKQQNSLANAFGCSRFIWNKKVEAFNNSEIKELTSTELKQKFDFLSNVSSAVLQQTERNFTAFKKQFFNKKRKKSLGRPKFKSKYNKQSIRFTNQGNYIKDNRITLIRIGKVKINLHKHLPTESRILSYTVSKTKTNKYFVSVLVETTIEALPKTNKSVGIDVGLSSFATLSNSTFVDNPRFFRKNQTKLARMQRIMSRKVKGSNRYNKHKRKVAKIHESIANQRNNFLHNISTNIVKEFDIICIESLSVDEMLQNRKLAKSISDASWSKFFSMIEYKCNYYDKQFVRIDKWFPSTKTCNNCGLIKEKIDLSQRIYKCESCNISIDRDLNAALNIEAVGVTTAIRTKETEGLPSVVESV